MKLDRNVLRMIGDELNKPANVTSKLGDRLDMTNADFMVKSMMQKAMTGTLDDQIKFFDRLAKWGLLDQLDIEEGLLNDLKEELRDTKEENKALRRKHELAADLADIRLCDALDLLAAADHLLAGAVSEDPTGVLAVRRRILKMRLEVADARDVARTAASWTPGQTAEDWVRKSIAEDNERERAREAQLQEFDRQHGFHQDRSDDPEDDDFFPDLTRED